jgi:hypothetical protein
MWERYQAVSRLWHGGGMHRLELEDGELYSMILLKGLT